MKDNPRLAPPLELGHWPNHLELPCEDGSFVHHFLEHPQSILLTEPLAPWLRIRHPDGHYCIGQDCGIYYRRLQVPPFAKAIAPDWYYVPDVPPLRDGQVRRSYVMWDELRAPLLLLEFVSGTGAEERDRTPETGKFWIYEHAIRPGFYGIYEQDPGRVEVYQFVVDHFEPLPPDKRGHVVIPPLGLALGIWRGEYQNLHMPWLRWYTLDGILLPTGDESVEQERRRTQQERQRAEIEHRRAEEEHQRAERFAARLRALGVDPEKEP